MAAQSPIPLDGGWVREGVEGGKLMSTHRAKGFTWTPLGKALAVTVAVLCAVVTSGCAAITKDHQVAVNGVPINQLYADSGQVKTDANPSKQDKSW